MRYPSGYEESRLTEHTSKCLVTPPTMSLEQLSGIDVILVGHVHPGQLTSKSHFSTWSGLDLEVPPAGSFASTLSKRSGTIQSMLSVKGAKVGEDLA